MIAMNGTTVSERRACGDSLVIALGMIPTKITNTRARKYLFLDLTKYIIPKIIKRKSVGYNWPNPCC